MSLLDELNCPVHVGGYDKNGKRICKNCGKSWAAIRKEK